MIKNIIFDIGFVLVNFDFDKYIRTEFDEETCQAIEGGLGSTLLA